MNVKPGDLAVVTGCPVTELNGCPVEVLSRAADDFEFGPMWNCTAPSMREEGFEQIPIPDAMLRPISGMPVHDEQLDEVTA
jgi:hypothetical protein